MGTNLDSTPDADGFALSGPCETCGFTPDDLTPAGAIDALQSFPARWRTTLAVHLDEADPVGSLGSRIGPLGWSALEHAGHVRDVVHALDMRIQRVLREDHPTLPLTPDTPAAGANEQGPAVVLAALTVSSDQLAGTIEHTPPAGWERTACRAGQTITALHLAREAVHEGVHHLLQAADTIEAARAQVKPATSVV